MMEMTQFSLLVFPRALYNFIRVCTTRVKKGNLILNCNIFFSILHNWFSYNFQLVVGNLELLLHVACTAKLFSKLIAHPLSICFYTRLSPQVWILSLAQQHKYLQKFPEHADGALRWRKSPNQRLKNKTRNRFYW